MMPSRLMTLMMLGLCIGVSTAIAMAAESETGIQISKVWSRAMPATATTGVVYFQLDNHGAADQLLTVSTPIAETAEIHTHVQHKDMLRMQAITSLELPAHAQVLFEPGSYHVMLKGLKQPLTAGSQFPLSLKFAHTPEQQISVPILEQAPSLSGAPGALHNH